MPTPEELQALRQNGAISPETAAALAKRLAEQGAAGIDNPVNAFVAKWKAGPGAQPAANASAPAPAAAAPRAPKQKAEPKFSPAILAAMEKAGKDNKILESIRSKYIYSEMPDGTPIIGSSAGLVPSVQFEKVGIIPDKGRLALGIRPESLTPEEMEWLIRRKESQDARDASSAIDAVRPKDKYDAIVDNVAAKRGAK